MYIQDGRDDSDSDEYWDSDESSEASSDDETYCAGCRRDFVNTHALYEHLANSSAHNWCFDCSRDFNSEGALINVSNIVRAWLLELSRRI
jgi:hypothetical protein